ncbi:DUF3027 domain-containing protein [Aeromicrobium sp. Leaf350]|uniref:DUF3027 domain-containing protein n=1 Tax=Aeromicrobium sp. Leaf350 TaxID=2876565 RepID=UPI001E4BFC2D|nr:DUF3027 domain-containing protein [Aeromicrobium sp. Leaf350]
MSVEQMLQAAEPFARAVVVEAAGEDVVGAHLRTDVDADGWVSHAFEALQPGYRGWSWVVSLTAVAADAEPTVNDLVLLPGSEAIVAPAWTPYRDRIRPGDLGPGDVLPPDADDLRLVPAWSAGDVDVETDRHEARELTGGRTWVLSREGRDMAAQRWHDGDGGPHTAIAQQASGTCRTCGFRLGLVGALADRFGVCANGMANDDGRVVDLEHGCGAHSGVKLSRATAVRELPDPYFDTITNDVVAKPEPKPEPEPEVVAEAEPIVEEPGVELEVPVEVAVESAAEPEPVAEAEPVAAEQPDADQPDSSV